MALSRAPLRSGSRTCDWSKSSHLIRQMMPYLAPRERPRAGCLLCKSLTLRDLSRKPVYPPHTGTFGLRPPPRGAATLEEGRRFAAYWQSVDASFDETEITDKEVDPYLLTSVDAGIDGSYSFEHHHVHPAPTSPHLPRSTLESTLHPPPSTLGKDKR